MRKSIVVVKEGVRIPFNGTVIDGFALVDESSETGVSTPAKLEPSEGKNNAIAGTTIVKGWLKIQAYPDSKMKESGFSKLEMSGFGNLIIMFLLAIGAGMLFAVVAYVVTHSCIATILSSLLGLGVGVYESWGKLMH